MDPRCGNPKAENLRRKSWRSPKRITSARFWMPIVARREPPALSVAMIVSSRLFFMIAASRHCRRKRLALGRIAPHLPLSRRRSAPTYSVSLLPAACHRRGTPTPHQPRLLPLPPAPHRSPAEEKHHFLNGCPCPQTARLRRG